MAAAVVYMPPNTMHIRSAPPLTRVPEASGATSHDALSNLPAGDMWVFAYGSLMWNPGFPHRQALLAQIHGLHRDLCVWSFVHRGSEAHPGLVLGLDRGGSCIGIAHRVAESDRHATVAYLYERELVTHVYLPVVRRIRIDGKGVVPALTFVVDRQHRQYAGRLAPALAATTIRHARGRSGPNPDYFANTIAHLEALGIQCPRLRAVESALADGQ